MTGQGSHEAWLRLVLTPGLGSRTQRRLLQHFGGAAAIFQAAPAALARIVPPEIAHRLLDSGCADAVTAALDWAAQAGNRLLTLEDAEYPRALLDTPDPPCLLYAKGRCELLNRPALAVVGSRSPTPQGARDAEAFAAALSQAGLTVVSGLALGIDGAAHRGALSGDGSTVAVVGTGIDRVYPARHRELARVIAERGVIISEFPLGTAALRSHFPRRNRIIAGLARGVLVVEAAVASGSLITARLAAEQGRDVFALPGSIHSPLAKGCHRLIKDGAKLVDEVRDILEELGLAGPVAAAPSAGPLPQRHARLVEAMGLEACDMDQLAQRTGDPADALSAALLELELAGHIASLPGGRYQRLA